MEDYRLQVKIKNNRILSLLEYYGFINVNQFCKENGLSPSVVGELINGKVPAINKDGGWKKAAVDLATTLKVHPDLLFSDRQKRSALKRNNAEMVFGESQLESIANLTPEQLLIEDQSSIEVTINNAVDQLTPRQKTVLEMRFGLNGQETHTLGEVGQLFDVTGARIRQIEEKALRRLRHPGRSGPLRRFVYSDDEHLYDEEP